MVCDRCGYDNPESNRYCGMCGMRLDAKPKPAAEVAPLDAKPKPAAEAAPPPPAPQPPAPPSTAASVAAASRSQQTSILGLDGEAPSSTERPRPRVTGPSFLGLNDEPSPNDAGYLLDDDEEQGGHFGLIIASLLLIAVAVGAFHYRSQLSAYAAPLYAAVMQRSNPQPQAPPATTDPAAAATSTPPPAANPGTPAVPAPQPAAAAPQPAPEDKPAQAPDAKTTEAAAPANPPEEAAPKAKGEDRTPRTKASQAAKFERASRPKPRAAEPVSPENDPLLKLAQKYIRGEGVRADCTTGMAYLREAMKRPNYAAASQMGALYATGTCVREDRVAAYRWFTSALQMAPDNQYLGLERDKLYGQMTSAERHRADQQSLR